MIGVFDSGVGGLAAVRELRRLSPSVDVCFFADRENAPYGTKTPAELCRLVSRDVAILRGFGADRILMACCTASTVWPLLSESDRAVAFPIISPAARCAALGTKNHRVAVIATEATVRSRAFTARIAEFSPAVRTTEIAAQALVCLAEEKLRYGRLPAGADGILDRVAAAVAATGADRLILGCTHFSHLENELRARLPGVETIGAATEGARALLAAENRTPKHKAV